MIKRGNKKAEEGGPSSMGYIIGFILIAGVAIFAFYWFYSTGSDIFDKKDILPGDLTVAAQVCEFSASQNDKTSYCVEPKRMKIAGKQGYFNCPYIKSELGADIPSSSNIVCDNYSTPSGWATYYCNQLHDAKSSDLEKTWVNGCKCVKIPAAENRVESVEAECVN